MSFKVTQISYDEYLELLPGIRTVLKNWYLPSYFTCYEKTTILVAKNKNTLAGVWIIPLVKRQGRVAAERDYRYFPYCAPLLFERDNLKVRAILKEFFILLKSECQYIELPMDLDTTNLSVIQSLGAMIEWRHTHVMESNNYQWTDRLNNHINHAQKMVQVEIGCQAELFKFEKAIKGRINEIGSRKMMALRLIHDKRGEIFIAKDSSDTAVAGIFIMFDEQCAYWMHTWQEPEAPRGTVSLLAKTAIEYTFLTRKLNRFDFEGSVIQNVDYYFSGFNADIRPYGFIHWSNDDAELSTLIMNARNIEGRLINDA